MSVVGVVVELADQGVVDGDVYAGLEGVEAALM